MDLTAKKLAITGGVVLASGALIGSSFAGPALADVTCDAGATLLSDSRCEVIETASGTFTPPAGVTSLEALVVGAGGSGLTAGYGGGGGDVQIVTLNTSGDVTFEVGLGVNGADGGASSVTQGGVTTTANGGLVTPGSLVGGNSGNGNVSTGGGGSGAGASATSFDGGAGIVVSTLTSTLFLDDADCYGGGGAQVMMWSPYPTATCGGAWEDNYVQGTQGVTGDESADYHEPVANSGGGGTSFVTPNDSGYSRTDNPGADGVVIFRYKLSGDDSAAAMPNTGLTTAGLLATGTFGAGLLIAAALAFRTRLRLVETAADDRLSRALRRLNASLHRNIR